MTVPFTRLGERVPLFLVPGEGFKATGRVHPGSLLISPKGIYSWTASSAALDETAILAFLDEEQEVRGDFLLLGTGRLALLPSPALRHEIEQRGLGFEFMDTGAACRTYNVLIAESRLFCAALLSI
jgi:uncharacterized protein